MPREESTNFLPYAEHDPSCAVVAITPPDKAFMHTYYDVCPWSPSGRYLCCLRLPFEDAQPEPSDAAELCVIDLARRTIEAVFTTTGWGFQTAAHQAWGKTDRYLYFNDKREDVPVGVRLDLDTGRARYFDGPIWQIRPDETSAVSSCLIRGNLTQPGYGVSVRPEHQLKNTTTADAQDGIHHIDLESGRRTLLVSLAQVWEVMPDREDLKGATLYAFHVKYNPQGTRLLFVVRARFEDGRYLASLVVCDADGSGLRVIVPHRLWRRGGHHPIWHPNGRQVLMNLTPGEAGMRFCLVDAETGKLEVLVDEPPGMGHPSISSDERFLLTDDTRESGNTRTAAIRLVDLRERTWRELCRAQSPAVGGSPLRRDAHPVWDRDSKRVCFLAAPGGRRQLFIADPSLPSGEDMEF